VAPFVRLSTVRTFVEARPLMRRRQALLLLVGSLLACDDRSSSSASPEKTPRVVSLSPSTTEAMFAVGAGDRLVGRSSQCDYPLAALKLPVVGGFANPSIEAILALQPSLVTGSRSPAGPALEEALQSHGVKTFFPATDSIAQIVELHRALGLQVDRAEGGEREAKRIERAVREVQRKHEGDAKVRVALLFDFGPLVAAGPGGFPDELIRLAGGENVVTKGGSYPQLDVEHLLVLDPDVLVDGAGTQDQATRLAELRGKAGFSALRAVKEGRVVTLESSASMRPGPRIAEGLEEMARVIHVGGAP